MNRKKPSMRRSTDRDIASFFRISYDLLEYGQREPWLIGYGGVRQMIEEELTRYQDRARANRWSLVADQLAVPAPTWVTTTC